MKKKLPRHDSGRVSYDERTTKGTTPLDYCAFILFIVNKKSKKNNHYLLIKNNKFNFLKNFNIFPMEEVNNPKNFDKDLNFKMSNMNMNIKIEFKNKYNLNKNNFWIDPTKLQNYTLPTFTKKIVKFLESHK